MPEGRLCRDCGKPDPRLRVGPYPRHKCADCMTTTATLQRKRRGAAKATYAMRARVYAEAEGLCRQCGIHCRWVKRDRYDRAPDLAEVDHIVPVNKGGGRGWKNLQLLCKQCNRTKGVN